MAYSVEDFMRDSEEIAKQNRKKTRNIMQGIIEATPKAPEVKLNGLNATLDHTVEGFRRGGVGIGNTVKTAVANKNQGLADTFDTLVRTKGIKEPIQNPYRERQQAIMDSMVKSALDMSNRSAALDEKYAHLPASTQWLSKAVGGTAQMIPAVAAGLVAGPMAGRMVLGSQVSGNSASQALAEGANLDKASLYGTAEAAKEVAIERMFGVIPGLGKGAINPNRLIEKGIKSNIGQLVAKTGVGAVGEGLEEGVAQIATPFLQRATYNPEAENASLPEIVDAFGQGAVGGLLFGGAANTVNYAQNRKAQKTVNAPVSQQELTNRPVAPNEQQVPADLAYKNSQGQGVNAVNPENNQEQPKPQIDPINMDILQDADDSNIGNDILGFINQASTKTKLNYRIVNGLPDHVNAFIENGTIVYNANKLDKPETVRYVTAHEVYHSMGGNLEHAQIGNLALEYLAGLQNQKRSNDTDSWIIQKKMDEYESMGKQLNGNEAVDEIGAEFMEYALSDERVANYILTKNPNVFQKVWHYITDQISYFTKKATLSKAEREQFKILHEAQKIYAKGIKNINPQVSTRQYSMDSNLRGQFDQWLNGEMVNGEYFTLGNTPASLQSIGAKDLPLIMSQDVLVKITGDKHSISLDELAKLPDQIANPIMVFKGTVPNSMVVLTEIQDKSGNEVISAIHLEKKQDRLLVNKLASTYGKRNIVNYVNNNIENGNLLSMDNEKASAWFTSRGLQLPKLVQTITDANNSIFNPDENINGEIKNNGNESFSLGQNSEEKTPYERLVEKYGAMNPGENPARDIEVPKFINDNRKTSQWARTAMEAKPVDDETVKLIQKDMAEDLSSHDFSYEIETDKDALNKANIVIDFEGYDNAAKAWQAKFASGQRMKKADMVLGERLIQEAINNNDYATAVKLISDVAALGSEMGQSVQALRMLKKLTPEGLLMSMERTILRINRQLLENGGNPVRLSKVARERILGSKSQDELDVAINMAYLELSDQMPANLSDKIIAWRYMAMLGNPRTHVRNMLSNAVMMPVQYAKDVVGTGLEKAFLSKDERTKTLYASKELRDFAKKNFKDEAKEMLAAGGSKYNDPMGRIRENQQIFKPKLMEKTRLGVSNSLEWEDMVFKKRAYISSFARFAQSRGWSAEYLANNKAARNEAQQYAVLEAQKATFQEASDFASALNQLERTNAATKILVGSLMPFKKTPINILKRGFEYSPMGILNGLKKISHDVKNNKCTKAEALDNMAAGMTGTMIMALGYFMASMGWASAGSDDERRKENYDRLMGEQEYAINLPGGGSYTIDWLSPSAMPLLVGVELFNQFSTESEEPPFPRVIHAFTKIADPVLEMSMLSGLSNALRTYQNDTSAKFSDYAYNVATGYASQFVPTVLGQVARSIDDTKRSSYAPKDSPYTKGGEQFARQTMNKIPGASRLSEPSVDMWGREVKQPGTGSGNDTVDMATRAFLNMVSPGLYKPNTTTPLDKKLTALYEATGESKVLPKYPEKTITYDDKNYYLSSKDYTSFSKNVGQANYKDVNSFIGSSYFKEMHQDQQAKVIANLYEYNTSDAKYGYLKKQGVEYSNSGYAKAKEAVNAGIEPYEYFAIKSYFSGDDFDKAKEKYDTCKRLDLDVDVYKSVSKDLYGIRADKNSNGKTVKNSRKKKVYAYLSDCNMTAKQKQYFWKQEYPGKK